MPPPTTSQLVSRRRNALAPPRHPVDEAPRATRVALVGAGFIADFHLRILAETPGVELVCVCDADLERARAAARRYGAPHAAERLEDLAELGVEVAHLTVPPALHAPLARRLLELGIGVFVEKPLAPSAAAGAELCALAEERGLALAVNHNAIFHPAFARLRARVAAGEVGRLEHVRIVLSVPLRQLDAGDYSHWMFRAPRNIVLEQATHPLSQLQCLIGRVREVRTTHLWTRVLPTGVPFHDRWLVAARGARGTAELYLAFGQEFTRSTLEVLGSDGSLEADLFHDHLVGERKTQWLDFWNSFCAGLGRAAGYARDALRGLVRWSGFTLGLAPRRDAFFVGMRDSIRAFHAALQRGAAPPSSGEEALEVLEWCDALAGDLSAEPAPPLVPSIDVAARPGEVAVLGASGFIGRRVVAKLLEREVPVTALVRRLHSLPPELTEPARDGRLRLLQVGLDDARGLAEALAGVRACVHLATGGGDRWEEVEERMVAGSLRVARACEAAGVARLVYVSSVAALYLGPDAGGSRPGRRELGDNARPDPLPARRAPYARGKIETERALAAHAAEGRCELVVARPGVVLGAGTPMQHSGLGLWVRDNHCVGWGRGEHALPVVLADDVAEALVRAALHPGAELSGKALNLCSRAPLSARGIVAAMAEVSGRRLVFHPRPLWVSQTLEVGKWLVKKAGRRADARFPSYRDLKSRALVPALRCDLARDVLGWEPVEDPRELLSRALEGYRPPSGRGADE